jgi:hypothetical protein
MNKGSDMNPENVSIITGENTKRAEAKNPDNRFLEAIKLNWLIIKVQTENKKILIHLVDSRKFPLAGVNKLKVNGKKGGNSVTGVIVLSEF